MVRDRSTSGSACTRAARRRSWPRSSPTSASRSPSSSASSSPGASSMLAESIHSLADTGNQGLLMLGGKQARAPGRRREHPFGYGRERYFWSFVVALVLFMRGRPVRDLRGHPEAARPARDRPRPASPSPSSASPSCWRRYSLRTARAARRTTSGAIAVVGGGSSARSKSPELPVVLLEDLGAADRPALRADRPDAGRGHRRRRAGTASATLVHRPAAGGDRRDPRRRDEEPADRRVGRPPSTRRDHPGGHRRRRPTCAGCIHLRTLHLGPRRAAGGRQDRPAPRTSTADRSPPRSTPPRRASARRCRSRA